jgi:hypothetical protein
MNNVTDRQAHEGLLGDVGAPGGADECRRHLVVGHAVGLGQAFLDLQRLVIGQLVRLDAHGVAGDVGHAWHGPRHDVLDGFLAAGRIRVLDVGHRELGAATEFNAEVETALGNRNQDGQGNGDPGNQEPDLPVADEVVRAFARVELIAER